MMDNQFAKGCKTSAQDASKSYPKSAAGTIGSSAKSEMTMGRSTVPLDRRGLRMATLGMLAAIPGLALAGSSRAAYSSQDSISAPLRVVEYSDGLIDRRLLWIRCDDFEVRAANSFAPPFAHFLDDLAAHEAAKLADEEAVVADGERPVSSTGFDHIP
jgi:hypothetical protein